MHRLTFALALLAGIAQADTINYFVNLDLTADPVGRIVDFSGDFLFPQFDPSLGALNSITYTLGVNGFFRFDILSRTASSPWNDYNTSLNVSFLGSSLSRGAGPVAGTGGLPCGTTAFPAPCPSATVGYNGGAGYSFNGSLANPNSYLGTSTNDIPISFWATAVPQFNTSVVVGDLLGPQHGGAGLNLTYNYTPVPFVETVSAAPEPRYLWLLLGVGLLGAACNRRLVHIVAAKI